MTETVEPYVPQRARRSELRRRRRQRRQRLAAAALVLSVVAAVVAAFVLVKGAPKPHAEIGPQARTQRTLLLQVRAPDGTAEASTLLAADAASSTGAAVLVPRQVIVNVPGSGSGPFANALAAGDSAPSRNALADLLGVQVDGSWVLDQAAFAQLVDALGGVQATADVPVVVDNAVVVPQGAQKLDGARAVALMTFLAPGEPEQARLARVQSVLDGLLSALPPDAAAVSSALTALGGASATTGPPAGTAAVLTGLAKAQKAQQLQYDVLPVIPIDSGVGATSFRVDAPAVKALVDRQLAQSIPPGVRQSGNRVLVLNGVGTPGLGDAVRTKLVAAGFVFVGSRNAEHFDYPATHVLVPEATPQDQALGERVAKALGVKGVVEQADLGSVADVVVIVGADFAP